MVPYRSRMARPVGAAVLRPSLAGMCADCWNATMGVPAAAAAGRWPLAAYKDRVPFTHRRNMSPGASKADYMAERATAVDRVVCQRDGTR